MQNRYLCLHAKEWKEYLSYSIICRRYANSLLNKYVEATDRGLISFYLGMEIFRDGLRGDITLHQEKYNTEILDRWGMTNCKSQNSFEKI